MHLHTHPEHLSPKVLAALKAGCFRFDSAMLGFGGCPMANDDLVGNVATEDLVRILEQEGYELDLNRMEFAEARKLANVIFH
jgi:hydroxymethylglutaryl-CoA lyase